MKENKWEDQIKWGLTAFIVLASVSGVVFFFLHWTEFRSFLDTMARLLAPVIYGAVLAYLMRWIYNPIFSLAGFSLRGLSSFFGRVIGKRFSRIQFENPFHLPAISFSGLSAIKTAGTRDPGSGESKKGDAGAGNGLKPQSGKDLEKEAVTAGSRQDSGKTLDGVEKGGSFRRTAKVIATVLSLVLLLLAVAGLFYLIIPELVQSIRTVSLTLPERSAALYNQVIAALQGDEIPPFLRDFFRDLSGTFQLDLENIMRQLSNFGNILTQFSSGVWSMVNFIKNILIGLIVMVYLLNMKESLLVESKKLVYAFLPAGWARALIGVCREADEAFGGFIVGKLLDSLIIGILTFIVLSIMRMPYTMLVSVVVGVTNIIPFFGPFIGAIPSFVLILLVNPLKSIYFIIAILIIQQIDGNILGPRILGGSTGLSSFWVLFSIILFGGLFGVPGMIVAVPLWSVIMKLMERLVERHLKKKGLPLDGESYRDKGY